MFELRQPASGRRQILSELRSRCGESGALRSRVPAQQNIHVVIQPPPALPRSRVAYVLLAFFFGWARNPQLLCEADRFRGGAAADVAALLRASRSGRRHLGHRRNAGGQPGRQRSPDERERRCSCRDPSGGFNSSYGDTGVCCRHKTSGSESGQRRAWAFAL